MNWKGDDFRAIDPIVSDLLPEKSTVTIEEIQGGLTESRVFRLTVDDQKKLAEMPRVLKIGPTDVIGDELWRYFHYAQHKPPGERSRVEVAKGYPFMKWPLTNDSTRQTASAFQPIQADHDPTFRTPIEHAGTGAIVYTFVGQYERTIPLVKWASGKEPSVLGPTVDKVLEILKFWHHRTAILQRSVQDIVINDSVMSRLKTRSELDTSFSKPLKTPSIGDILHLLKRLRKEKQRRDWTKTCVVHGDPHGSNVFVNVNDSGEIHDVALIDWGKVTSEQHELTDLSILLTDLVFRACWHKVRKNALNVADQLFEQKLDGYHPEEANLVLTTHVCRMLTWRNPATGKKWFQQKAREIAWEWINRRLRS